MKAQGRELHSRLEQLTKEMVRSDAEGSKAWGVNERPDEELHLEGLSGEILTLELLEQRPVESHRIPPV